MKLASMFVAIGIFTVLAQSLSGKPKAGEILLGLNSGLFLLQYFVGHIRGHRVSLREYVTIATLANVVFGGWLSVTA